VAKQFAYQARNKSGQLIAGTMQAENEAAVAAYIQSQGYYITRIKALPPSGQIAKYLPHWRRIRLRDLAVFCRQFSTMIDAGLPMLTCLDILIEQTSNRQLKLAAQGVYRQVQAGESLHHALANYPRVFPSVMVSMVEAGELGGALDVVMERLAIQFEKEYKLSERIKSALAYPLVVLTMATLSVIFIFTFVLPVFAELFASMRIELPLLTRLLLAVSNFWLEYWWLVIAGLFTVVLLAGYIIQQPAVQLVIDNCLMRLPVYGVLRRKIAVARLARMLSTLISGGVPIISALEVVKKTIGSPSMVRTFTAAQNSVSKGLGLAEPLATSNLIDRMVVQMVAVGEETGALDKMLAKIADFYENEIEDVIGRLTSVFEPILIAILGVIIGLLVIAVILPLFEMTTKFN